LTLAFAPDPAVAQGVDCARLPAQIAALEGPAPVRRNRNAGAARRLSVDLNRAIGHARALGCDRPQIPFFGPGAPPQCPGLNAQIQQMQANLGQLQSGSGQADRAAARADLIARYNAYCRGAVQAATQPRQRGFFEQLFSGGDLLPHPPPNPIPFSDQPPVEEGGPRGGSQAVCVRSCDGGFFPLSVSARGADPDRLTNLCQALCPNVQVSVFTRSPNSEISTAVSLDNGAPYSTLPNASRFQKTFDSACTCKPPDQSWVEALAGAERLLGQERRGDIVVTEEKAAELSAPRSESKRRAKLGGAGPNPAALANTARDSANEPSLRNGSDAFQDVVGPDGIKRRVRIVGPTL
jgi:hypothetical protein